MQTVLFLCTGNYYRSRFAEELFNCRANEVKLAWKASSRGLAVGDVVNEGAVSPIVIAGLKRRGYAAQNANRMPRQCTIADLGGASLVVALCEQEHRPLLRLRFPNWEAHVQYWEVFDIGLTAPDIALEEISSNVRLLMSEF